MTSPVDTSVKHYFSSMAGAPVLTKAAGTLIALLDACLVLGFDLKTATSVTVADGVATVAVSGGHSATLHSVILVSGATGSHAPLNGEQKVTALGNGTVSFATAAPAGTAAGTITIKMAPAGWEKTYSSGNIAVYRSLHPQANGHYLRVDDRGGQPGPGFARVRGYVTMTDVSTGTGLFPLATQLEDDTANGAYWPKGYNSGAGTQPIGWSIFADGRIFYYQPMIYQSEMAPAQAAEYPCGYMQGFGDLKAYRTAGDVWCTALSAGLSSTSPQSYTESGSFSAGQIYSGANFTPRKADGTGASQAGMTVGYGFRSVESLSGAVTSEMGPFPNGIDGALIYAPRYWRIRSLQGPDDYVPRAEVPGVLSIPQGGVFAGIGRDKILDGEGAWAGRKLFGLLTGSPTTTITSSPASVGITLVDITGPWR